MTNAILQHRRDVMNATTRGHAGQVNARSLLRSMNGFGVRPPCAARSGRSIFAHSRSNQRKCVLAERDHSHPENMGAQLTAARTDLR
jgi:hypothetical protein